MAHDNFIDKKRRRLNLRDVHIDDVLPEYFASAYPKFISLLERYYEFQNQYDATELLNHLFSSRDITETDITLLNFIEDELLLGGSYFEGSGDKRAAANFSSTLFRAKGSKYSIEWFFRSFFQLDPEVLYTKENVFLIADDKNSNSFSSKLGPSSLRFLTDDKLYQTFAILVRAGIPVNQWKKLFKLFVHPAGMYLGGEVLLEGQANLALGSSQEPATIDDFPSPVVTLTPSNEPATEGLQVTYTVGTTNNIYPGTYKWWLEHVDTEDADFTVVPPQKVEYTVTAVADQTGAANNQIIIGQDPTGWEGYDIIHYDGSELTGEYIPRNGYIVAVSTSPNTLTLSQPLADADAGGEQFRIIGGWQDLEVEVNPATDKVYGTPTSGQIQFTIANDFFQDETDGDITIPDRIEQYKLYIADWCRTPQRNQVFENTYSINDVHYTVTTTSVDELDSNQAITIDGINLPDGTIYWYIADKTTNVGSDPALDATLTAHTNDFGNSAGVQNGVGFANRQPVTISSGTGTFNVRIKKDYITEGAQTFRVFLVGPATYTDYHGDANTVELLAHLNPSDTTQQGQLVTINDTSIYPRYTTGDTSITEGDDVVINVSTISGTPDSGDGSEHNPNGDYFYNSGTETLTTDGVQWEILDSLDGRISTLTGREPFSAASTNLTMSATTVDGYYRGTQQATVRVTNHDGIQSTGTITMVDAAVSNPVITGPTSITEGAASGSWAFTHKNSVPGTNYYWWVDGLADADFTSTPPRSGSRGVLTTDSTANSVTAAGDTMIMTSTMDLAAVLDALTENTESFTIKVSDSNTDAANEIASFAVDITDVIPEYTVSSNTPVTEGNDIVLSLAVVNPVSEDVNVTVADDGSGRYTAGAYTFTSPAYNDITIATTLDPAIQNALGENISVSVTGASSGQTDSTTVVLNDVVPIYEVITSQTSYVEGDTIVVGLNFTNSVEEDVDLAISDDGTGRYSTAGDTFTWNGSSYGNLNIPTSINAGTDNPQTITLTVTGQSSGVQDTVTFDLTDLLPTYSLTIRNTSNTSVTSLVEGATIRLDLGVTDAVGEDVDWSVSPADARLSATSGTFTSPGYVDIDITTSAPGTFENDPLLTFTVTGQTTGVQATDTLTLEDGAADITYTLTAPAGNVTEGDAWSFTVVASLTNTGTYEDFDWDITGDTRVNASGQITAAQFSSGGGSVTVNRTSTSDPVYQGPTTITVDGTGATYSNTASDTFSLVDEAGSLNSVTGPASINDGGTAASATIAINPSNAGSYSFPTSSNTTTGTGSQSYALSFGGSPASANAYIKFANDFKIKGVGNITPGSNSFLEVDNGTWATGVTSELASDYEIRATLNSSSTSSNSSFTGTFGSWLGLGTNRTWELDVTNSTGIETPQYSIQFEIRDVATSTVQDTFSVYYIGVEIDTSGGL